MSRSLTIADLRSPQEAAFVATLFELGGPQHAADAALRAGYGTTYEEAERAAAFLLASSRISRVITGEIKARFDVAAATAFNTLLEVCVDKRAPARARISAAQEILNRSSLGPVPSKSMNVNANVGGIEAWLEKLDASEKGPFAGDVIDVTPTAPRDDEGDAPS